MSYVIQVELNDNHCAIFQVVNTQILHRANNEFEIFSENNNPDNYYIFETQREASIWFDFWYQQRRNNSDLLLVGHRLSGEHDARPLRLHHPLYHHGDPHLNVVQSMLLSVEDSSRLKQGSPASLHSGDDVCFTLNIKKSALLSGKRGFGQVFSSS